MACDDFCNRLLTQTESPCHLQKLVSAGRDALVATYSSALDSFKSFAATLGTYFQAVTDPATFGRIAAAHGEYGSSGANFVNTALTFMDCLNGGN